MPDITIGPLSIGTEAYFTFKEPINYYVRNKYNLNSLSVKLKVVSIITMKDTIFTDLRDPYTDLYQPAGISETDYKKDLVDNVPFVSLLYVDAKGIERYIRTPVSYIDSVSSITSIEYQNKLIVMDLNRLPADFDTSVFFLELKDFIETRMGIVPSLKEVVVGPVELVDNQEHDMRETVRGNLMTVHKTLSAQLAEVTLMHDQLLARLNFLNISLG
jgi:hypothetical protein